MLYGDQIQAPIKALPPKSQQGTKQIKKTSGKGDDEVEMKFEWDQKRNAVFDDVNTTNEVSQRGADDHTGKAIDAYFSGLGSFSSTEVEVIDIENDDKNKSENDGEMLVKDDGHVSFEYQGKEEENNKVDVSLIDEQKENIIKGSRPRTQKQCRSCNHHQKDLNQQLAHLLKATTPNKVTQVKGTRTYVQ